MRRLIGLLLLITFVAVPGHAQQSPSADQGASGKMEKLQSLMKGRTDSGDAQAVSDRAWENKENFSFGGTGLKLVEGLALCAGVFLIGIHFYKRAAGLNDRTARRRMRVLERCSLGGKASAVLLQLDDRELLVAVGADQVTLLSGTDDSTVSDLKESLDVLCKNDSPVSPSASC